MKLINLQLLRGFAVTIVILYHLNPNFIPSGYLGVDIFFLLSGYIVTKKIEEEKYSILNFYRRRFLRLYPALIFNLIIFSILFYLLTRRDFVSQYLNDIFYSITSTENLHLFTSESNYFNSLQGINPFKHLWSLGVEAQFYFIWPILIFISSIVQKKYKLILPFISLFLSYFLYLLTHYENGFYLPQLRFWELISGGVLYLLSNNISIPETIKNLSLKLQSLVFLSLLIIAFTGYDIKLLQILVSILTLLYIILSVKVDKVFGGNYIIVRFFKLLGDMSYSLYLSHFFIISLLTKIYGNFDLISYLIFALTLVLVSTLSFRIEMVANNKKFFSIQIILTIFLIISSLLPILNNLTYKKSLNNTSSSIEKVSVEDLLEASITTIESYKFSLPKAESLSQDKLFLPTENNCPEGVKACYGLQSKRAKVIILYGDSHAQMYWPTLYNLSKKLNYQSYLIYRGGCPPVKFPSNNIDNKIGFTSELLDKCNQFYDSSLNLINSLPKVDKLIITGSLKTINWVDLLPNTFAEYNNQKILYIRDFYYPNPDILDCYSKTDKEKSGNCNFSILDDLFGKYRDKEYNILTASKVEYFDPVSFQCIKLICPGVIDNIKVYQDSAHFSVKFAQLLLHDFNSFLKF